MIKTAVILAAGKGTRLKHLVKDKPKGFVKIYDKTLIERSIEKLIGCGIERIIIGTGYRHEFYDRLSEAHPLIATIYNADYSNSRSMYTLFKISEYFKEDSFLLIDRV